MAEIAELYSRLVERCYKCDVYCSVNSSSSPRHLRLNWVTNNGILNEFAGGCYGGPGSKKMVEVVEMKCCELFSC